MRRTLSVLLTILILGLVLPAVCEPATDDAESLRSFLQQHYGITILMGDECREYPSEDYQIVITPEGRTAFQQMVYGDRRFTETLRLLDDMLSVYPPDFFSRFKWTNHYGGVIFLLVDDIILDGVSLGGLQSGADYDGRIIIYLSRIGAKERAIHHEIGHAVDYRIRWQFPNAFDGWIDLNPEGFLYTGDFAVVRTERENDEPEDWFVREYSMIDEYEDRATVFDALMTKDEAWWSTRPHLQRKAQYLLEKVEPVFGEIFPGE